MSNNIIIKEYLNVSDNKFSFCFGGYCCYGKYIQSDIADELTYLKFISQLHSIPTNLNINYIKE
jgi:hypothetical protein